MDYDGRVRTRHRRRMGGHAAYSVVVHIYTATKSGEPY